GVLLLCIVPLAGALAIWTQGSPPGNIWPWGNLLTGSLLVLALLALVRSYRRPPTPLARAQLKWILWASAVAVLAYALGDVARVVPRVAMLPAAACFPIAFAFAILRRRLWDIDRLINRTLVYGL